MTLLIKNKDETMPSRKTRSSHLCTSPRRDGPIFLTGCDVIFSSMIQIHKKSPRALESSAPPWEFSLVSRLIADVSDVTAAMLVVKNKSNSLRWEMNSILMQI